MTQVEILLDKAKNAVSPASYSEVSRRMGLTRQSLSKWKNGDSPLPDERIAQLAKMAHEDVGYWLATIHAENAAEPARSAWASVAKRLATAAMITLTMGSGLMPKIAEASTTYGQGKATNVHYVRFTAWLRRLRQPRPAPAWSMQHA